MAPDTRKNMETPFGDPTAPAQRSVDVVPDDTATIDPTRGLYIGNTGDVKVTMNGLGGADSVFKNVPSGKILPISVNKVYATGTTATNIRALY